MSRCRLCDSSDVHPYLSLGTLPLANGFLRERDLTTEEPRYLLQVGFCPSCALSQLTTTVSPETLFREYVYASSTSDTIRRHAQWLAATLGGRFALGNSDLIVELASNDGCVLKAFAERGAKVLGIQPAQNIAELARASGVETISAFFSSATAHDVLKSHGPARLVIARHVLAHVPELRDFVAGIRSILAPSGVAVVEVPYLREMLQRLEYDTI